MVVHLAGNLPADDLNGLAAVEGKLIDGHLAGERHLVMGVVTVTGTKAALKEGFKPNPIVSFARIDAVPDELEAEARDLMERIFQARMGGLTLDFPEPEPDAEPLQLAELDGDGYRFVIADEPQGKFSLTVVTASGAMVVQRHALPMDAYEEVPNPGEYQLVHLRSELRDLAASLVAGYEESFVVDAEVVDEDEEAGE